MLLRRCGIATIGFLLMLAGPARAAPEVGWWWNPSESGRGFFVESLNGIIYIAGYFYESDGRATWLVAGGPNSDSYSYQGRLLAFGNGQTLAGDYRPPSAPADAGPVSITFSDDTHGTIVWPGGTIPIVRHRFGGDEGESTAEPGWWWNDAESGRGYSIEVQGDKLFMVAFMYDAAGHPVWYFSAGAMSTPTTYAGSWLQFSGGQTQGGPYRPPGDPVVVGQVGIEFTGADQATLSLVDASAASDTAAKKGKIIAIKRQFPKPKAPPPSRWMAAFEIEDKVVNIRKPGKNPGLTQVVTWKWSAKDFTVEMDELQPVMAASYHSERGVVAAFPTFLQVTSDNKEICEERPGQTFIENLKVDAVKLVVTGDGMAYGTVDVDYGLPLVELACTIDGKPVSSSAPVSFNLHFALPAKPLDSGVVEGRVKDQVVLDFDNGANSSKRTISVHWSFVPVK
ncbi:MAG: hypothetical protein U1F54_13405 [Burkholderiales bacterium]